MAKYKRTHSSGGKKVSTANQVENFYISKNGGVTYEDAVEYLSFETYSSPCSIKLNNENTVHYIDADSKMVFTDIEIDKFTILTGGVEYSFTGMSIR